MSYINLYIKYNFTQDDTLDYKKDSINLLFSPSITTTRTSVDLTKLDIPLKGLDISDDDNTDKILYRLNNLLYGTPDKEDSERANGFKISNNNLSITEFEKVLPDVRTSLKKFMNYIYGKYGISII